MIVVTAPTGLIGHQVVDRLLARRQPLRVVVRDRTRLASTVRERAEVVVGSHGDPDVMDHALVGADALFWLVPPDPTALSVEAAYVDFTRAAAASLTRNGVGHVVSVSALGRGVPVPGGFVGGSLAMDDLLAGTGAAFRALTMPSFMDNILRQVDNITTRGVIRSPIAGDRRMPSVATCDVADVAARLLAERSWSGQDSLAVLGPEDLSFGDMARIISDVLRMPVRFERVSDEAYKATFLRFGMSEAMAQGMLDMAIAKDRGLDTAVVRDRSNSSPTTFRRWCENVLRPAVQA